MRKRVLGVMINLGHDKSILSDAIVAVEPLSGLGKYYKTDGDDHKMRSRVLIAHAEGELLAGRTAQTILRDLTEPSNKDLVRQWMIDKSAEELKEYGTLAETKEKEPFTELENMSSKDRHSTFIELGKTLAKDRIERDALIASLVHYGTVADAIDSLPYGKNKFYALIKKYGIDTRDYRNVTDDADMAKDNIGLE